MVKLHIIYGCDIIYHQFNVEYGNHVMDSFKFESGRTLENVNVEYSTSGIPKYDEEGNIVNAIIFFPNRYGGRPILAQYHNLIKDNDFDKDDFYFIIITSLGMADSCSPSSTGLRFNFPEYTFKDSVNFKKQFLAEKFNIKKISGLIGEGLGGFEIFTWASEYPDDMEFIIVLNSSFKIGGYGYISSKCVESIIESCDDYYSDGYNSSFSMLSVAIFRSLFLGYFPMKVARNLSNDEIDALMDDYVEEGLFIDIHDFKYRNDCVLNYNIEDKISNIKVESLILGTGDVLFINPETDLLPLANLIENSKVVVFDSTVENYYEEEDYSQLGCELVTFLKQFK